ncbi:MAG: putative glycine cleavage protein [Hyphomicrobiales bacterium]|nr:putative glycine cleavage protein [Hyphomicrobiales bacterium]
MPSAFLDDRGLLRIAGEDARSFLQGLVTCDMDKISPQAAGFGALLTPQGKILFDFLILEDAEGFLLDVDADLATALIKRLSMYKLRARVSLAPDLQHGVLALWDGAVSDGLEFDDPRHPGLGRRAVMPRELAETSASAAKADYEAHRIICGVPRGGVDFAYGEVFPHDADMDLIHGVDFKKGCYVGQEVVSRMAHRGAARKRIVPVRLRGPAPPPGSEIRAGDLSIGVMGSSARERGLAMIRTDRAEEAIAAGQEMVAGASIIELLPANMP